MNLDCIREQINTIDSQLVELLEKRMELVDQVTAYKRATGKPVLDTSRENAVLERVGKLVQRMITALPFKQPLAILWPNQEPINLPN